MRVRRKNRKEHGLAVLIGISAIMLLGMLTLVRALWKLQVPERGAYQSMFEGQSMRRVSLPAIRGKIYDVNDVCLADSVPSYCIAIYTEELRAPRSLVANAMERIHQIWVRVGVDYPPDVDYQDVKRHVELTPDQPLTVWSQLNDERQTRWLEAYEKWTDPPPDSTTKRRLHIKGLAEPLTADGSIVLDMKELQDKGTSTAANTLEMVYEISERIGIKREVTYRKIEDHIFAQKPLPLLAWKGIDARTMARWADTCSDLKGTDIFCLPARRYTQGENFAHLIGFTMTADAMKELPDGERVHFDMRGIRGRKGLEALYNELLRGEPGAKLVQIDAAGYRHHDVQTRLPVAGGDLLLTIDSHIQQFALDALNMSLNTDPFEGPTRGAVVVLDPNNGDVLAMASSPGFDPNKYMRDASYRQELLKDKTARTYNRAVYGSYAPGSTFKPVAGLGILREYPSYSTVYHNCPRYHMVGRRRMGCTAAHGELNLRGAIMNSCNVFMYKMVLECGYGAIYRMAKDFGLGQPAGLFPDLDADVQDIKIKGTTYGRLPEEAMGLADSCNLAIGQGNILVSPLQMAMVVATIANGGTLYRPRLIKKFRHRPDLPYQENPTWPIRRIEIPQHALDVIRGGMHDVVMNPDGSAPVVQVGDIVIAGKTGTAEYGPKEERKQNTWMTSFAPYDFPRYAIAFIVEDGKYGGTTVGPRLHELYKNIFMYDGTLPPDFKDKRRRRR